MNNIFSIGEASKITGISVQMLRNYANMGLVKPENVDQFTGYRYYTINQVHLLDKIKYLRGLDIPVSIIADAISSSDNRALKKLLLEQLEQLDKKIEKLEDSKRLIEWNISSIDYQKKTSDISHPYIRYFTERYALAVEYSPEEGPEGAEIRLAKLRHGKESCDIRYFRQYGYVLKIRGFKERRFEPEKEFMFIRTDKCKMSEAVRNHLLVLPKGEYLCYWDSKKLEMIQCENILRTELEYGGPVIAIEYSNGLREYASNLKCEYQIFLGK